MSDALERLRQEVDSDPVARAAYEDAKARTTIVSALRGLLEHSDDFDLAELILAMGDQFENVEDVLSGYIDPRLSTLQQIARHLGVKLVVQIRVLSDDESGR